MPISRDRASELIKDGVPYRSCCGTTLDRQHLPECANHVAVPKPKDYLLENRPGLCEACRMVGFHSQSCVNRTVTAENPSHYQHPSGIETILINLEMTFLAGSAFKYVQRYEAKSNPPEDLRKARWYVQMMDEHDDDIWIDIASKERGTPLLRLMLKFEENPYRVKFYEAILELDVVAMADAIEQARESIA